MTCSKIFLAQVVGSKGCKGTRWPLESEILESVNPYVSSPFLILAILQDGY